MARNANPNLQAVIAAHSKFQCAILTLQMKGVSVRSAHFTEIPDYFQEYQDFPVSLIMFDGTQHFDSLPDGYDLCHITDTKETILINRYPDGLTVDEIAKKLASSGQAVIEWAIRLDPVGFDMICTRGDRHFPRPLEMVRYFDRDPEEAGENIYDEIHRAVAVLSDWVREFPKFRR